MKRLLFITFLILSSGIHFMAGAQQINIRRYTIEDGLVNNDIMSIYQDSRGFIWLCTRGGLSRYDGSRFTNFTTDNGLTNDMINDIYEIAPQQFIVAQNLNGPRLLKNERMSPLPGKKITVNKFYPQRNGRLLASADQVGVVEWNKANGLQPVNAGYTSSVDRFSRMNDSLWLAIDLNQCIQFTNTKMEVRSPFRLLGTTTTFTDSRGRTWVGTTRGLKLVDAAAQPSKGFVWAPLPPAFDLPILNKAYIADIFEDSEQNLWIGTFTGLVKVNENGSSLILTEKDGLPTSFISCIREDKQHNIWVGTPMGVAKLQMNSGINAIELDLGFDHLGALAFSPIAENTLQIFDGRSVSKLDLNTGKLSDKELYNVSGYPIYRLSDAEIIIVKGEKSLIFRAGQAVPETIKWPDTIFSTIISNGPDHFLAAANGIIFSVVDGKSKEIFRFDATTNIYRLIFDRNNYLWVGTWGNGLFKMRMSDSAGLDIVDTISGRLPDHHIRGLYCDRKNELWIGTRYKGVIRMIEKKNGQYEFQQYGTSQGLSSDFVSVINRDPYGNIWVGSQQGLDKLIPSGDGYRVFNFGKVNKIFSKISQVIFLDSNRLVAAGYPSTILVADLKKDAMPPLPVFFTRVAGGPADSSFAENTGVLKLPYDKAQIYFEFSSPQFINEDFSKYSYRLLGGNDTTWNIAGNSHSVSFANLRPGNYSFQVRTLGFNGLWGNASVFGFTVSAPYWQKPWFIFLAASALGLLIYLLYRYRVQQLIRLQKVRNRIATDLHDEIGSNLTNISILSNLSKKNLLQPQKAGDFLQRISEEVSSSSQALDDIIWSVNSNHDTLEETVARMRRYAAELFDSANISYELYLDPAFEGRRLSMEQRRDLYLLYKEAVNNISKHAAARHVAIQIAIDHNQLLLSVKDDGRGFDTGKESTRHGLKGMKQRVRRWKGKIIIESGPGRGTFIQVKLPVSK